MRMAWRMLIQPDRSPGFRASSLVACGIILSSFITRVGSAQVPETPPSTSESAPPVTPSGEPGATPASPAPPPPAPVAPVYIAPAYAQPRTYAPTRAAVDPAERVGEAHQDRVLFMPTAYTHPEGTVYLSSYEIVLLQAGYAFTDTTQVTLSGTPPIGEENSDDRVFLLDASLKSAFIDEPWVRVAAIGSVSGIFGLEEGNFVLGRVGGVATACLERGCRSSMSVSANALLGGPATLMVTGAGVIWRIANWAALLVEADTLVPLGSETGEFSGIAVMGGFRFPYRTWALDLGVARGLDTEDEPDPAVVPILAFTYRFLP